MIGLTICVIIAFVACLYAYKRNGENPFSSPSAPFCDVQDVEDVDDDIFAHELDREEDFEIIQYQAEIDHWTAQMEQYKALQATIKVEIAAVLDYREKKLTLLPSLVEKPIEYMELASWLTDNKRDYSEKREATLQRQLITVSNQIYACQKRIAKAQQKLMEVV